MAFSELETQAVRDSLTSLKGRLKAYFALHSFSQKWMFPYGYNFEKPENYDELVMANELYISIFLIKYSNDYWLVMSCVWKYIIFGQ